MEHKLAALGRKPEGTCIQVGEGKRIKRRT